MNDKDVKKKRFNLFSRAYSLDGKGVDKGELRVIEKPTLANFFKLTARSINKLFSLNLLMIAGNFPALFGIFALGYTTVSHVEPYHTVYAPLLGITRLTDSPSVAALFSVWGEVTTKSYYTTLSYVFFGLMLLCLITFGPVNVGMSYIMRNIIRGEPVYVWSDFWYAIKRNLKQSLIFGVFDLLIIAMLVYDIRWFGLVMNGDMVLGIMYYMSYAMAVFYFFARLYTYLMMLTFDLSIFKLIKNSVYFAILGIKRNVMALLGVIVVCVLDYLLTMIFIPLGLILPFIILFSLCAFMGTYAAFPKIKQVMIDPYYNEVKDDADREETE